MKIPDHLFNHAIEYIFAGAMVLIGIGALAYMDARHITHVRWVETQIQDEQREVEKLTMYNKFGGQTNKPARDQVIMQTENHIEDLKRQLEQLE